MEIAEKKKELYMTSLLKLRLSLSQRQLALFVVQLTQLGFLYTKKEKKKKISGWNGFEEI